MIVIDDYGNEVRVATYGTIWSTDHIVSKSVYGPYECLRCGGKSSRPKFQEPCYVVQYFTNRPGIYDCLWPDQEQGRGKIGRWYP
jgi:hypothetical protein